MLGLQLASPGYAVWFVVVVACLVVAALGRRAGSRQMQAVVHERQRDNVFYGNRSGIGRKRLWLGACGLLLIAFSLLGPIRGSSLLPVQRKGIDIVVCLDTSRSMLAQDVGDSRLDEAKKELRGLMEVLEGDRMALIAFSGDVRQVSPLTRDMQTLAWFVDSLGPEDNLLGGTDLGGAIDHAVELFDDRSGSHEAIVLVTDGEDLEGNGLQAAQVAAERGIQIYVLGMGTEGGAKVPAEGSGWVRDENDQDVISYLDPTTLHSIAEVTGGMYIQAFGTVLPLEQLYTRGFSRLEGRQYAQGFEEIPSDRFQWPLLLGLLLLAIEAWISGRKGKRKGALGPAGPGLETTGALPRTSPAADNPMSARPASTPVAARHRTNGTSAAGTVAAGPVKTGDEIS